jgi:hypothetical protein
MKFDSAMNLQTEVFSKVFEYVEFNQPNKFSDFGKRIPTYVAPRALDVDPIMANAFTVPNAIATMNLITNMHTEPNIKAATARRTGKIVKQATDEIALGIGLKVGARSNDYELVAMFQNRKLKNADILSKIETQSRGEVRIVYAGRVRARAPWHRELNSTLRMGSSIGHHKVTAGTLGCFVQHLENGKSGVLSNNHILAAVNKAAIFDEIRQPGRVDGGTTANRVASLEGFVPLLFNGMPNFLDGAWASHDNPPRTQNQRDRFDSAENIVGQLASGAPQDVLPGDFVMKTGRTTGYTQGAVDAININNLNVDMGAGSIARFDGQIQINSLSKVPFSRGGDSGSLIVDTNSEPVGLLFAGSDSGGFENTGVTWANPIGEVLEQLNLEISI